MPPIPPPMIRKGTVMCHYTAVAGPGRCCGQIGFASAVVL
jgi:hypothetical protein